jgi:hypothetical protein
MPLSRTDITHSSSRCWADTWICGTSSVFPRRSLQIRPMAVTPKPAKGKGTQDKSCYTLLDLIRASVLRRAPVGRKPFGFVFRFIRGSSRRPCGNVEIAPLAISKRGGKRRETAVWFSAFCTARHFHRAQSADTAALVRQLLGPHLSTWPWCSKRSSIELTAAVSPSSLPQSSTGRLDVSRVLARS